MNTPKKSLWIFLEKLLHFIIFELFHLKPTNSQWNSFLQFIKFGIVGLSNTILSYVIYIGSLFALQAIQALPSIDYLIAQFIGFVLSVLWSFYWNNKYVFEKNDGKKRNLLQALLKTYISYAFTGLFLNSILSVLWIELLHISKIIAPIINLLVSVPLNFVMNKFWAFKETR